MQHILNQKEENNLNIISSNSYEHLQLPNPILVNRTEHLQLPKPCYSDVS